MNKEEQTYLDLLRDVIENGSERSDRTGVGTKSLFGSMLRFSLLDDTMPIITTKKTFYRGAIEEMLFFIRGETDTKKLEAKGVNIWKGNTSREFLDKQGLIHEEEGSLGLGYGFQWKHWGSGNGTWLDDYDMEGLKSGINQLENVFQSLKNEPHGRRHIVSAWNVEDLERMALPPCHWAHQYYVSDGMLSCMWIQRSVDLFLGFPLNLVGYSLLTHLMAKALGLKAKEVIFIGGDVHCYLNHIEQVKEQISREPFDFPKIKINKDLSSLKDIEETTLEDLEIVGYRHLPAIKGDMAI